MSDDSRRVLELLAQGKITVEEADQLLRALTDQPSRTDAAPKVDAGGTAKPRFIRIHVHKPAREGREAKDVNIRVPMAVVRGGMRLGTLIPGLQDRMNARLRERGMDVDLSKLDPAAIESILADLGEVNIDVNGSGEQVRITCE
ncbi:MAG TPA: hypothetical protein VI485_02735 [Vicinamibacterales bacterium]|nr:hypothetical protein [Vicinamibacterales bacterium]